MIKSLFFTFLFFLTAWELSEGITCYNCYTLTSTNIFGGRGSRGEISVPCADNITESNTYECPDANSVCALLRLKLGNQVEVLRSCAKSTADICNNGIPGGVEVISCDTCNTDLCNGDDGEPEPPPNNGTCPTVTFDVNLNVNLYVHNVN